MVRKGARCVPQRVQERACSSSAQQCVCPGVFSSFVLILPLWHPFNTQKKNFGHGGLIEKSFVSSLESSFYLSTTLTRSSRKLMAYTAQLHFSMRFAKLSFIPVIFVLIQCRPAPPPRHDYVCAAFVYPCTGVVVLAWVLQPAGVFSQYS